jgi:hypothetical protein
VQGLRTSLADLKEQQTRSTQGERAFAAAEQALKDALRAVVDAKSNTTGWQELLDIAKDQDGLLSDGSASDPDEPVFFSGVNATPGHYSFC